MRTAGRLLVRSLDIRRLPMGACRLATAAWWHLHDASGGAGVAGAMRTKCFAAPGPLERQRRHS